MLVFIFISMALGPNMIPFLPHDCQCRDCRFRWKS
jgi:hypothetical protein